MRRFLYKAKDGPIKVVKGVVEAENRQAAILKLEGMKLSPIQVVEKDEESRVSAPRETKVFAPAVSPDIDRGSHEAQQAAVSFEVGKVAHKDITLFTRQLSILLRSGVQMLKAIEIIMAQTEKPNLKRLYEGIYKAVKEGSMLSQALQSFPRVFTPLYSNMIRSGEASGKLKEQLQRIVNFREKEEELRSKIKSALAYPLFMLFAGILTVLTMVIFFLPKLAKIFLTSNQALPLPTKIVISITNFVTLRWYWILLGIVFLVEIFRYLSRDKSFLSAVKSKIPIVNSIYKKSEYASMTRTLGLLIDSGIPIHQALQLSAPTLSDGYLKSKLNEASRKIVEEGVSFAESMGQDKSLPPLVANLMAVGEVSGELPRSLNEISSIYEKEVEESVKLVTSLLEPIMILLIGSFVGFLIMAMLLPVFRMGVVGG